MSTFPYKGGGLLTSFLDISLWFFACRPELWSSFWIKHQSGEKIIFPLIFPAFFGHFFKNLVIGPCGVSKVINIRSGNSILDFIMHFPLSLYHFPPPFPHFPSPKGQRSLLTLLLPKKESKQLWTKMCIERWTLSLNVVNPDHLILPGYVLQPCFCNK